MTSIKAPFFIVIRKPDDGSIISGLVNDSPDFAKAKSLKEVREVIKRNVARGFEENDVFIFTSAPKEVSEDIYPREGEMHPDLAKLDDLYGYFDINPIATGLVGIPLLSELQDMLRSRYSFNLTHGDCWFFALAGYNLFGTKIVAASCPTKKAVESFKNGVLQENRDLKSHVDHVMCGLNNGAFYDIRGVFTNKTPKDIIVDYDKVSEIREYQDPVYIGILPDEMAKYRDDGAIMSNGQGQYVWVEEKDVHFQSEINFVFTELMTQELREEMAYIDHQGY